MKYGKRGMICWLLCLLLPACSLAKQQYYTITQVREQAAAGWHQTYTAHGRTIAVDVLPHVPKVEAVPMAQYQLAVLSPVEDALQRWTYDTNGVRGSLAIEADAQAVVNTRGYVESQAWYGGYDMDRRYIVSNPQTLQEVLSMIAEIMEGSGLNPDALYLAHPFCVAQCIYQDRKGVRDTQPGLLRLDLYQCLRGLPVVGDPSRAFMHDVEGLATPDRTSTALVLSPSQFVFFVNGLLQETQELAPDLPLCAFQQVVEALEAEMKAGRLRQVFQMSLGYVMLADQRNQVKPPIRWNEEDCFYALPVWAVDCIYVDGPGKELRDYSGPVWEGLGNNPYRTVEYMRLLVNAQTGKLIDPMDKRADRVIYKGFLSWEDVGGK